MLGQQASASSSLLLCNKLIDTKENLCSVAFHRALAAALLRVCLLALARPCPVTLRPLLFPD
jgi:hypothetical protein